MQKALLRPRWAKDATRGRTLGLEWQVLPVRLGPEGERTVRGT
jgi:hypothetical protein